MRCQPILYLLTLPGLFVLGAACRANVVTLNPVADAFVDSALPGNNYGGAGSLGIAAPGLAQGEFQSVLRFDTTSAVSAFNGAYGAGNWTIQSVRLQLTATAPNNAIFNAQAAGQFAARWMQNDTWVEGAGTPTAPTTAGITFASLPGFLGGSDEALGTFAFGGGTTGSATYPLALTSGFNADVAAGGLVSLRLSAADSSVSYLFNSRTFGTVASRPVLSITTTPAPGASGAVLAGGLMLARRRRRPCSPISSHP